MMKKRMTSKKKRLFIVSERTEIFIEFKTEKEFTHAIAIEIEIAHAFVLRIDSNPF